MKQIPWTGNKITEAGCYTGVKMEAYHGDVCDTASISSTGLRTIWDKSPAHYWSSSYLNPKRVQTDKPEFAFGRLAHKLLIEGPAGFGEEFAVRPDKWADYRSKDAQAWRDEQIAGGRTVVTEEQMAQVGEMALSLSRHPLIKAGALDGMIERSLFHKLDGKYWLKARPDALPEPTLASDLKTTGSVSDDDIQRSITSFSYNIQAAVVALSIKALTGKDLESFALVFVEKAPPYSVRVVTIPGEDIDRGIKQATAAFKEWAHCLETNEWPGPGSTDAEPVGLSKWARLMIDDKLALLNAIYEERSNA